MTRLALTIALSYPAAAATPATGESLAAEQTYTWWNLDALKTLDPQKNTDVEGSDAIRQLFEGLMNEDAKGAMVPGVAESHTVSGDRLTYTFALRDARWSDGAPVTAGDFVHGWQRLVDPATASEYAWFAELANIAGASEIIRGERPATDLGVRAVDDRTLEVTLTRPTPYFIKMLSHSSLFPAPRAAIEAHGDNWTEAGNLVGNGAYTLVNHDLGVQATMRKSETYWDAANTILTDIRAVVVNDINAALTRYLAGELDRVDAPAGQFPRLQRVVKHISDRVMVLYLGRVMELGATADLYAAPQHPYTQALLSAVPIRDPVRERAKRAIPLVGELPSPLAPPSGCVFGTRCPRAQAFCAQAVPPLAPVGATFAACHFPGPLTQAEIARRRAA